MLVDTWAWIEYLNGTTAGARVRDLLDAEPLAYTCPVVLAEVFSKVARELDHDLAEARVHAILQATAFIDHTREIGVEAGRLHAMRKAEVEGFGMADAFVLAAARSRGVPVLTGDPHFEGLEDAWML